MKRSPVIDFGFGVSKDLDPQIPVRDFLGAAVASLASFLLVFFLVWFGISYTLPNHTLFLIFFKSILNGNFLISINSIASTFLASVVGYIAFFEGFKARERVKHIRGRRYAESEEALKIAMKKSKMEIKDSSLGVNLNKDIFLSADRETLHFLIVGGVGAGKTTIAHHLLTSIFERRDRALIVDWKGDFTASYDGLIFNPLDARSCQWAVAKDVVSELDAAAFASRIIPDKKGGDAYFTNAGRSVLTALVIKLQSQKSLSWTWGDLYAEASAGYESIREAVANYYPHALQNIAEEGKQTQGVLSQIMAEFDVVRVLAQAEESNPKASKISAHSWLTKSWKKSQIILAGSSEHERICRAYMSAFITCAASKLQSLPDSKTRRVWFVCDEFPKLGKVEAIPSLIAFGRSKGARVVLLAQDIAQIREIYGADTAKALPSMVGTVIIGRTQGGETADEIAQKWIGKREIERRNITNQGAGKSSASWQREEIFVVHPAELQTELGKEGDHIKALVLGLGDYVLNLSFTFVAPPVFRPAYLLRDCFSLTKQHTPIETQLLDISKVEEFTFDEVL
jgi:type IV secretory pathway TraG/TraD family ATPase VirD4